MKKFLSGVLTATLVFSLAVSALAISEKMTIDVYPINILVNGQVFAPTDAQGNPVDVFTYKGTTYAPLRALAEAYGLEVGYDAASKTATVTDPDAKQTSVPDTTTQPDYSDWSAEEEAAYQEWKGMWEVVVSDRYVGLIGDRDTDRQERIDRFLTSCSVDFVEQCCVRFDHELCEQYSVFEMRYSFGSHYGVWGWKDTLETGMMQCGYRDFVDQHMKNPS